MEGNVQEMFNREARIWGVKMIIWDANLSLVVILWMKGH